MRAIGGNRGEGGARNRANNESGGDGAGREGPTPGGKPAGSSERARSSASRSVSACESSTRPSVTAAVLEAGSSHTAPVERHASSGGAEGVGKKPSASSTAAADSIVRRRFSASSIGPNQRSVSL